MMKTVFCSISSIYLLGPNFSSLSNPLFTGSQVAGVVFLLLYLSYFYFKVRYGSILEH